MLAVLLTLALASAAETCEAVPVLFKGVVLTPCAAGLCTESGATLLPSSSPIRQVLPGPASGVVALHRGRDIELWLGRQLSPLLRLESPDIRVRPVGTEGIALARTADSSTVISILDREGAERRVLQTGAAVVDFACGPGGTCVIVAQVPTAGRKILRFEEGQATDLGAVAQAQRVFWSAAKRLTQVWTGTSVLESAGANAWNVAPSRMVRGCPVLDIESGLIARSKK